MYPEDDLLPLSALQHMAVCPRQAALIHLEQAWRENLYTAQGRVQHERVDTVAHETRGDVRRAFGLRLRSLRLGLAGRADAVEFLRQEDGSWQPYPVEHKRGRPKADDCDLVQLCAQAMCLEEMLGRQVPEGALFYGKTRRRYPVPFTPELRSRTEDLAAELHAMYRSRVTPPAVRIARCRGCSLAGECLPGLGGRSVSRYLQQAMDSP